MNQLVGATKGKRFLPLCVDRDLNVAIKKWQQKQQIAHCVGEGEGGGRNQFSWGMQHVAAWPIDNAMNKTINR